MHCTHENACPRCSSHRIVRPGLLDRLGVVAAWVFAMGAVAIGGLTGPFLLMAFPFLFVIGTLIPAAHQRAFEPPKCADCGVVREDSPEEKPVPVLALPSPAE